MALFGRAPDGSGSCVESLFMYCSPKPFFLETQFPLSLTPPEPEKLVFLTPVAPAKWGLCLLAINVEPPLHKLSRTFV